MLREFVYDPVSTRILIVYQEPVNVESIFQARHTAMAPSEASCRLPYGAVVQILVLTNSSRSLDDVRLHRGVDMREMRCDELETNQEWL